jgi:hypothetical protein
MSTNSEALALGGSFTDADLINRKLQEAAEKFHLISPASTCPRLRSGCVVGLNVVPISADLETHDVGLGKRSLLRTALLKLANAAGISWDTSRSGRVDHGQHPYYVHWHAEGAWQSLDGTWLPVSGDLQLDLRDGSAATRKILESARARTGMAAEEVGRVQLRDTRAKILEHAQSKAKLRAIREALAIRAYTVAELAKPFVVARLMWVGDPNNVEDQKAIREHFLAGSAACFGRAQAPALQAPKPTTYELPPIDTTGELLDEEPPSEPALPQQATPAPAKLPSTPPPAGPATTQATHRAPAPTSHTHSRSHVIAKFGRGKGAPITEMTDSDLEWYAGAISRSVEDPSKARYRADNEAHLVDVTEEIASRGGPPDPSDAGGDQDDLPY